MHKHNFTTCGIPCTVGVWFHSGEKYPCLSISVHLNPYFAMLLNPHTDWKMPWGARQMRYAPHKAWSFIPGCAGSWLHPMLGEWCLSGSFPGGSFSKVEDIAPCTATTPGTADRVICWHGKQTRSGMVWSVPPGRGSRGAQLPPHSSPVFSSCRIWCSVTWKSGQIGRSLQPVLHSSAPPSPPARSHPLAQAQPDRIRNCQEDFGCDWLTKTPQDAHCFLS